jgi:hypothetical protein
MGSLTEVARLKKVLNAAKPDAVRLAALLAMVVA